jgi:hypothetical protein
VPNGTFIMSNSNNPFGECIYRYTRANAIADGVLVDLSQVETVKAHWKHPFACTDTVYGIIERAIEAGGWAGCQSKCNRGWVED